MTDVNPLFAVHMLNDGGKKKASEMAQAFDELLTKLGHLDGLEGREGSIVKTKLEEASFFAKKSMAVRKENQQ